MSAFDPDLPKIPSSTPLPFEGEQLVEQRINIPSPIIEGPTQEATRLRQETLGGVTPGKLYSGLVSQGVASFYPALEAYRDVAVAHKIAYGSDLNEEAVVRKYSSLTGLSMEAARANYEEAKQTLKFEGVKAAVAKAPNLGKWLIDPANMAVAYEDLDQLAAVESIMLSRYSNAYEQGAQAIENMGRGFARGGAAALFGVAESVGAESSVKYWEELVKDIDSGVVPFTDDVTGLRRFALDTVPAAVQIGLSAALAVITKSPYPVAAFYGATEGGSLNYDLRKQGVSQLRAAALGIGLGVVNGAIETLQVDKALGAAGVKRGLSSITRSAYREVAGNAIENVLQETLQNVNNEIATQLGTGEGDLAALGESVTQGLYEGATVGVITTMMGAPRLKQLFTKYAQGEEITRRLKAAAAVLGDTEVAKSIPEAAAGATNTITDGQELQLPADQVAKYFEQEPQVLNDFLEKLEVPREVFDDLVQNGGDLSFKTGNWLAKVANTEAGVDMFPLLRSSELESAIHLDAIRQELITEFSKFAEASNKLAQPGEIKDFDELLEWRNTIMQSGGISRTDANAYAMVLLNASSQLAPSAGKTRKEWIAKMLPHVEYQAKRAALYNSALRQGNVDVTTPEFQEFFRDSAVVEGETQKPLVVRHYTNEEFPIFEDQQANKKGFYFQDTERSDFSGKDNAFYVDAYLSIQNPLVINDYASSDILAGSKGKKEFSFTDEDFLYHQDIIDAGYDGVIGVDSKGNITEYVVFESSQIKSINNEGTFDTENPDIYYQVTPAMTLHMQEVTGVSANSEVLMDALDALSKIDMPIQTYLSKNSPFTQNRANRTGIQWYFSQNPAALAEALKIQEELKAAGLLDFDFVDKDGFLRELPLEDRRKVWRDPVIAKLSEGKYFLAPNTIPKAKLNAAPERAYNILSDESGEPIYFATEQEAKEALGEVAKLGETAAGLPFQGVTDKTKQQFSGFTRTVAQSLIEVIKPGVFEAWRGDLVKAAESIYANREADPKTYQAAGGKDLASVVKTMANFADPGKAAYTINSPTQHADKTLGAINPNTACPMFLVGNQGCYLDGCYVAAQGQGAQTYRYYMKAVYPGDVLFFTPQLVEALNLAGGMRINGGGDTLIGFKPQLRDIFRHAKTVGLRLKMITKQEVSLEIIQELRSELGEDFPDMEVQVTVDPYWTTPDKDFMPGLTLNANGDTMSYKDMLAYGIVDQNAGLEKEYALAGRATQEINGELHRKWGWTPEAFTAARDGKYADIADLIRPRVVVGHPAEMVYYAETMPDAIITWMHAAVPDMYSDVLGKVAPVGNYKSQPLVTKVDGEWRVLATTKLDMSASEVSKRLGAQVKQEKALAENIANLDTVLSNNGWYVKRAKGKKGKKGSVKGKSITQKKGYALEVFTETQRKKEEAKIAKLRKEHAELGLLNLQGKDAKEASYRSKAEAVSRDGDTLFFGYSSAKYTDVENYIRDNVDPADQDRIFSTISQQSCCQGQTEYACSGCNTPCSGHAPVGQVAFPASVGNAAELVEDNVKRYNQAARLTPSNDAQYLELAKDPEKNREELQQMVLRAAEAAGVPVLNEEGVTAFSVRREAPPKKTQKAYKLFRVKKDAPGELFALFVGSNDALPQDVWLDAIEGPAAGESKTGKKRVKSSLGPLSFRPGWHAGDIPLATHIGARNKVGGPIVGRKFDEVWAEVEVAADVDYQPEADANGTREDGKFVTVDADIKKMPKEGMYRYKTNPNMTGQWIISGSMKINRVLSEAEVNGILSEQSLNPMRWVEKSKNAKRWRPTELDLGRWGLTTDPAVNQKKLLDPVTYYKNGNPIPLSRRFKKSNPSIFFQSGSAGAGPYLATKTLEIFSKPELANRKGKMIKVATLSQVLKQKGTKKIVKDLFDTALSRPEFVGKQEIPFDDFRFIVEDLLLPLTQVHTNTYADWGLETAGFDKETTSYDTVIYNSPLSHGFEGDHFARVFSGSHTATTGRKKYNIRELTPGVFAAVSEDAPSGAVGQQLLSYLGTVGSEKAVNAWIKETHLGVNSGMFGHVRRWHRGEPSRYVVEIQSDTFQKVNANVLIGEELIANAETDEQIALRDEWYALQDKFSDYPRGSKIEYARITQLSDTIKKRERTLADLKADVARLDRRGRRPFSNEPTEEYSEVLEATLKDEKQELATAIADSPDYDALRAIVNKQDKIISKEMPKLFSIEEKQFAAHRLNSTERMIREEIRQAGIDGYTSVRFPLPLTAAGVEGFLDEPLEAAPYEVVKGGSDRLVAGDIIKATSTDQTLHVIDATVQTIVVSDEPAKFISSAAPTKEHVSKVLDGVLGAMPDEITFLSEDGFDILKVYFGQSRFDSFGGVKSWVIESAIRESYASKESRVMSHVAGTKHFDINTLEFKEELRAAIEGYLDSATLQERILEEYQRVRAVEGGWMVALPFTGPGGATKQTFSFMQPDSYKVEFDADDYPVEQQRILSKYDELGDTLRELRGEDGVEIVTDDNGYPWYEVSLSDQDASSPVVVFQEEGAPPPTVAGSLRSTPRGASLITATDHWIYLFENADKSTLLHEIWHGLLSEIEQLVDTGQADANIQKAWGSLLKFAGDNLDTQMSDGRPTVEKIMDQLEAYYFEGKAPSPSLAPSFRVISKWMRDVYGDVRGILNEAEMDPEVMDAFDHILASEEEIREAYHYYKVYQAVSDVVDPEEEKEQQARALKAASSGKKLEDAKSKVQQTTEEAIEKEAQIRVKAWLEATSGGRAALRRKISEDVNGEQVYKAIAAVRAIGGLDTDELVMTYGDGTARMIQSLHGKRMVNSTKGKSLEEALEGTGYKTGREMVEAMSSAAPLKDEITDRTNKVIEDKKVEFEEELRKREQRPSEEAVHSDTTLDFLIADIEVMAERLGKTLDTRMTQAGKKAMKEAAMDNLKTRMTTRAAASPTKWLTLENRAATQAFGYAESGKMEEAYQAMQDRIYYFHMAKASLDIREDMNRIERKYKSSKLGNLDKIEESFRKSVEDLISFYGLNSTTKAPKGSEPGRLIIPGSGLDVEADKDLLNLLPTYEDIIPEWLVSKNRPLPFTNFKDLTFDQLQELVDTIELLRQDGKGVIKVLEAAGAATREELAQLSINRMKELPKFSVRNRKTWIGKKLEWLQDVHALLVMPEFLMEELDGSPLLSGKPLGPMHKIFRIGANRENAFEERLSNLVEGGLREAFEVLKVERNQIVANHGEVFDIPGAPVPDVIKERTGIFTWDTDMLFAVALNMGNDANVHHMEFSEYGINADQRSAIARMLSADAWDAVQKIWDTIDTLYPDLNQTVKNLTHKSIPKEKATPFTVVTSEGTVKEIKGGYYPFISDANISDQAAGWKESEILMETARKQAVYRASSKPKDSATKARARDEETGKALGKKPTILSVNRVLMTHLKDTVRMITHAEYLQELDQLTRHPEWKQTFIEKKGKQQYAAVRRWINYQARPERRGMDALSRFMEDGRKLSTIATLGARIGTGLKQRLSMFNAIEAMDKAGNGTGAKYLMKGLQKVGLKSAVTGSQTQDTIDWVHGMSSEMKFRSNNFDREIRDFTKKFAPFRKSIKIGDVELDTDSLTEAAFWFVRINDSAAVYPLWLGAYEQAMTEKLNGITPGMTENQASELAVEYADTIVATSQPSSKPIDQAELQRLEGPFRLFVQFMTWRLKAGNRLMWYGKGYKRGQVSKKALVKHFALEWAMPAWAWMLIPALMYREEDEPEWYDIGTPVYDMMGWVPLLGEGVGAIRYGRAGKVPAFEGIERVAFAVGSMDNGDVAQSAFKWIRAMEWWAGVPISNPPVELLKYYKKLEDK